MESRFNGGLLGQIGVGIVVMLGTIVTLGIGLPWMICFAMRWYVKHIELDGVQLVFDGTGGQLFGNYLKWFLLTIITFGIYGLWMSLNIIKWVVKHIHHEGKI